MVGKLPVSIGVAVCGALAASGTPDVVKASRFGWNPTNATRSLQAALDSGAKTVRIDRQPGDWIVEPLALRSNQEVILEDGVIVRALPNAFKGLDDSLVSASRTTNTVLRGEGKARLRMRKREDYWDTTRYRRAEWRSCVSASGAVNFTIRNLSLEASGGDGVYVNRCVNMTVEDVFCDDNNRQGISVISADGLTLRRCTFMNTVGALPECGIDIEPHDRNDQYVRNILIENCLFASNACHGVTFSISGVTTKSPDVSITVRDCVIRDNRYCGIWLLLAGGSPNSKNGPVRGDILFERVKVFGNGTYPLSVENACDGFMRLTFKDCVFDGRNGNCGINFNNGLVKEDLGDCRFENCRLIVPGGVKEATFSGATGVGVAHLQGVLRVERDARVHQFDLGKWGSQFVPDPSLRDFPTSAFDHRKLRPAAPKSTPVPMSPVFRGRNTFVQYVPGAGEYPIIFQEHQCGAHMGDTGAEVTVYDEAGTTHDYFKLNPGGETHYVLKSSGKAVYRIFVRPYGNAYTVKSSWPGFGLALDNRAHILGGSDLRFYFQLPKGSDSIFFELAPPSGEPVTAELIDPSGKVVDSCEKRDATTILYAKFPPTTKDTGWCLRCVKVFDDLELRIGAPAVPVASFVKEAMLIE